MMSTAARRGHGKRTSRPLKINFTPLSRGSSTFGGLGDIICLVDSVLRVPPSRRRVQAAFFAPSALSRKNSSSSFTAWSRRDGRRQGHLDGSAERPRFGCAFPSDAAMPAASSSAGAVARQRSKANANGVASGRSSPKIRGRSIDTKAPPSSKPSSFIASKTLQVQPQESKGAGTPCTFSIVRAQSHDGLRLEKRRWLRPPH